MDIEKSVIIWSLILSAPFFFCLTLFTSPHQEYLWGEAIRSLYENFGAIEVIVIVMQQSVM